MTNSNCTDRLACKIQHFAELIQQIQNEKENLLLAMDRESCDKEKLKSQIYLCQELEKEYYDIFQDILYR
jgi:hypothetical protein